MVYAGRDSKYKRIVWGGTLVCPSMSDLFAPSGWSWVSLFQRHILICILYNHIQKPRLRVPQRPSEELGLFCASEWCSLMTKVRLYVDALNFYYSVARRYEIRATNSCYCFVSWAPVRDGE